MKTATPGIAFDISGLPIEPGDLLRTFHFRDRSRGGRVKYLYHVVTIRDGYLWCIPAKYMEQSIERQGGCWWLLEGRNDTEVIDGVGPEPKKCWYERKRLHAELPCALLVAVQAVAGAVVSPAAAIFSSEQFCDGR